MNIKRKILLTDVVILAYLFAAIVVDEGAMIMKVMRVCLFGLTAFMIVRRKEFSLIHMLCGYYLFWCFQFAVFGGLWIKIMRLQWLKHCCLVLYVCIVYYILLKLNHDV